MKDEIAFRQSKRLGHTRAYFDIFNMLAEWAVNEAGGKKAVFGTKPGVADYTPTDLGKEGAKAVQSNLANLPDIQALLEKILPGYGEMISQGSKNTLSLLRGEIPQDVQAAIQRSSAFKSLQGGYGGSPMSRALTARDIGRTSLDLTQEGGNAAQRWAGIAQGSVAPFTITTPMQAAQTERNNLYKQATEQFKYNVAAAPDPGAAGVFNLQTALGSMAASFGMSSALGGMRGQQSQQQPGQNYGSAGNWGYANQPGQYYGYDWGRTG